MTFVLKLLGVNWPQANEDELTRLADQLDKLASAIDSTQMAADKALAKLGEVYHGESADKLAELWSTISKYSSMVVDVLGVASTGIKAAALVIQICKGQALVQLINIQAQLAASSATFGLSTPAIIAAGKVVMSEILDEAVSRLAHELAKPIADLADAVVAKVLPSGSGSGSAGQGFGVDVAAMAQCALDIRKHSDDVDSAGSSFRRVVESLDVGKPGDAFGKLAIAVAEQVAKTVGMDVLTRILNSFRGTADKMDTVVRNLSENEDTHTQQMNGGMALLGTSFGKGPTGPTQLAGGAAAPGAAVTATPAWRHSTRYAPTSVAAVAAVAASSAASSVRADTKASTARSTSSVE
ncbi:hypothetical protein ACFQ0T_02335 [Kitasatospora gansuensis]